MQTAIKFRVYGRPAPQGSKKSIGNNRFVEASKYLPAWRKAVTQAAKEVISESFVPIQGAVKLKVQFYLERPKSVSIKNRPHPIVPPDVSKLIRAVEDAITDAGLWEDDSQVCYVESSKFYADDEEPGALIYITNL